WRGTLAAVEQIVQPSCHFIRAYIARHITDYLGCLEKEQAGNLAYLKPLHQARFRLRIDLGDQELPGILSGRLCQLLFKRYTEWGGPLPKDQNQWQACL